MADDNFILVNTHRYTSTIFLCLLFSFLFCFSFLPPLVSLSGKEEFHGKASHIGLLIGVLIMSVLIVWVICRKSNYHRKQSVFWPKQCRHCARVVSLLYAKINSGHQTQTSSPLSTQTGTTATKTSSEKPATSDVNFQQESSSPLQIQDQTVTSDGAQCKSKHQCRTRHHHHHHLHCRDKLTTRSGTSMMADHNQLQSQTIPLCVNQTSIQNIDYSDTDPSTSGHTSGHFSHIFSKSQQKKKISSSEDAVRSVCTSGEGVQEELKKPREDQSNPFGDSEANFYFPKHYNSLIRAFIVFGTIGVVFNLLKVIESVICLTTQELSSAAFLEEMLSISLIALLPLSMKLLITYRGAILVGTITNCYAVAFVFGACIWFSALGIILPVSQEFLGNSFIDTWPACEINGTFGKVMKYIGPSMTNIDVGCGIIGAAVMSMIWSSVVPDHLLDLEEPISDFDDFTSPTPRMGIRGRITRLKKRLHRWWWLKRGGNSSERASLLKSRDTESAIKSPVQILFTRIFVIFAVSGAVYFALSCVVLNGFDGYFSPSTRVYVQWCCRMVYCLPLVVSYMHQSTITKANKLFISSWGPILNGSLDGGDTILLVGLFAVYTISIFRLISAVGILCRPPPVIVDDVAFASFATIFTLFDMTKVWLMTSFLLLVRRQVIEGYPQTKWTLVCSVYTCVANGIQWLLYRRETNTWPKEAAFFVQPVGEVIGFLLGPIVMLNELYAAVVAYELAKTLLSEHGHENVRNETTADVDKNGNK